VVVDVAVDRGNHPGRRLAFGVGAPGLRVVQRMRVRLVDPADAGPARVPEHRRLDVRAPKRRRQQRIGGDRVAQEAHVVAQFADLLRALVDQADTASGQLDRTMTEQRIPRPAVERGTDRRIVRVEAVPGKQEEQPGRVPAADLEPVEGGEGLLNGNQNVEPGVAGPGRRQRTDFGRGPQPVTANRPLGVGERGGGAVHRFEIHVAETASAVVETRCQPVHRRGARPQRIGDRGPQRLIAHQGPHGRTGAQPPVPGGKPGGGSGEGLGERLSLGVAAIAHRGLGGAAGGREALQQLARVDRRFGVGAHQDADDPAHG